MRTEAELTESLAGSLAKSKRPKFSPRDLSVTQVDEDSPAPATQALVQAQGAELTAQALNAWNLRLSGEAMVDIAHSLALPISAAKALIAQAHNAIAEDLKANIELNRALDIERTDQLLKSFMPLAKAGEPKSADIVLKCLSHRAKLTGADPQIGRMDKPENVLVWVQAQLPQISRLVDSLPLE